MFECKAENYSFLYRYSFLLTRLIWDCKTNWCAKIYYGKEANARCNADSFRGNLMVQPSQPDSLFTWSNIPCVIKYLLPEIKIVCFQPRFRSHFWRTLIALGTTRINRFGVCELALLSLNAFNVKTLYFIRISWRKTRIQDRCSFRLDYGDLI